MPNAIARLAILLAMKQPAKMSILAVTIVGSTASIELGLIPLLSLRGENNSRQQPNLSLIEPEKESENHS
jgi:hypothetical protein